MVVTHFIQVSSKIIVDGDTVGSLNALTAKYPIRQDNIPQ